MQTPGKQIEAQTPMIESRGRNTLIERLSKADGASPMKKACEHLNINNK